MKIGLLTIATGKYIQFIDPLWESAKKYFAPNHEVTMFVFTDSTEFVPKQRQVKIMQRHMPWPGPTLFRYNIFNHNKHLFYDMDYLFYSDADMLFVSEVGDEILSDSVATNHPGFFNKPRQAFTYETNPESKAFINSSEGTHYFAGGFNGGKKETYLKMVETLSKNIMDDSQRNIIAVWHDESHFNRYMIDNPPSLILNPSYCYPESWNIPFEKKLLALDKNHNEMRT